MNDQNQPMDFNPGPTPAPTKKNNTTLIIIIIVVVVLCICCIVGGGGYWLWNNGDKLLRQGTSAILQML
jgi:flagellar basal body-associated protein FliL